MSRRRFYKEARATPEKTVTLDGQPIKTPGKRPLQLPTMALAEAIAAEWQAQGEKIDPATMTLTKLANTAIDRVAPSRVRIIAEMIDYAGSDLVCYRADRPPDLVASQRQHWDPVLAWAAAQLRADLVTATGVVHVPQPQAGLEALRTHFESIESFALTAIHNMMTLTGSGLIAAMVGKGALTPEHAWAAAHVDEDYQIAHWGWDNEAKAKRTLRQREFDYCFEFLRLL